MEAMETISAKTLRRRLGSVLDQIVREKKPLLVTRVNRPTVVLLPYESYVAWTEEREKRLQRAAQGLGRWVSRHADALRGIDAVEAVRETRAGR